jgi:hypothetical protein
VLDRGRLKDKVLFEESPGRTIRNVLDWHVTSDPLGSKGQDRIRNTRASLGEMPESDKGKGEQE